MLWPNPLCMLARSFGCNDSPNGRLHPRFPAVYLEGHARRRRNARLLRIDPLRLRRRRRWRRQQQRRQLTTGANRAVAVPAAAVPAAAVPAAAVPAAAVPAAAVPAAAVRTGDAL